jgi:hypothetical protein
MIGDVFYIIICAIFIIIIIGFCYEQSNKREINFVVALLLCVLLTPIIAYYIFHLLPLRHPLFCSNCGNTKSEKRICGVCGNDILDLGK